MKWWPVWGLTKGLTERKPYATELTVETKETIFRKSLHIYPIDVGNSNDLNFDIRALQAPQYNIHRFGVFFADVPRHADVLLVLGRPTEKMVPVLMETVNQMPEPFSIVVVENEESTRGRSQTGVDIKSLNLPNVVVHLTNYREPGELIALFLKIKEGTN